MIPEPSGNAQPGRPKGLFAHLSPEALESLHRCAQETTTNADEEEASLASQDSPQAAEDAKTEGKAQPSRPASGRDARRSTQPETSKCPYLHERDLKDLKASGLTDETIQANGLYTESVGEKLAALLNRRPTSGKQIPLFCLGLGLVIPYHDLAGKVVSYRVKPHSPRTRDGKPIKYEQPVGEPPHAYFPRSSRTRLPDGKSPIYITEGEKKALALSQLGLPAVGLGGVWCGCKAGTEELIDDLAGLPLTDRVVYIVFDYDPKATTRRDVEAARTRLARALKAKGTGEVYDVPLPSGPKGAKQGVDDFLVASGEKGPAAFRQLVEKAIPVIKIIASLEPAGGVISVFKIIHMPVLGEAAYRGPIGQFLRAVAPYTEATDAAVLAHLLPALGTVIGPGPYVWAGTRQAARVNTLLVGPTSTGRKGTSLAPVDMLMERAVPDFWATQRAQGLATGEGLVARVAGTQAEKRLYVVEQEFSKVLAQHRREGNIISQTLRESYDSGNLEVMTKTNPLQATGAHIPITGHISPEELLDRFNHIEMANGFGNRFLWFVVKSDKVLPCCEPIPEVIFEAFIEHVQAVADFPDVCINLAPASQRRWENEIYPSLREDKPGFAGALVARGQSMVLRLAMIYYLVDPPEEGGSQGIEPVHLDAALAVWRYCEESVQMLFHGNAGTFLGDKIIGLLANGPMTKNEMNDHLSPRQKAQVAGVLATLEEAGLVRKTVVKREGPGRPAMAWELAE
jgi:hypothetical protein